MIVVDVHTGKTVRIGDRIPDHPDWVLLEVRERFFSASAVVSTPYGRKAFPLQVRYTHPNFFLEKVGFIPS